LKLGILLKHHFFSGLQTECGHYRMVSEEAYKQLLDIHRKDVLTQSQDVRLKECLELMDEVSFRGVSHLVVLTAIFCQLQNKVPTTLNRDAWGNQTIKRLENELNQVRCIC
jgi:hypothetical protein